MTIPSTRCKRGVFTWLVLLANGAFTLALLVALFAKKGFHVGVGALALIAGTCALAFAAQVGMASGTPRLPHPPPTASYNEHWGWHRVQDFKRPYIWPLIIGLLLAAAVLGALWLATS